MEIQLMENLGMAMRPEGLDINQVTPETGRLSQANPSPTLRPGQSYYIFYWYFIFNI